MKKISRGRKAGNGSDALFWHFCDQQERAAKLDADLLLRLILECKEDKEGEEWAKLRDRVVEHFVREHPGRRPQTWWERESPRLSAEACAKLYKYDFAGIPGPRRMITPGLKVVELDFDSYCGIPYRTMVRDNQGVVRQWCAGGKGRPGADSEGQGPQFEAQAEYLRRHNLLLPGEAERCDFSPEGYASAQSFIPPWVK
jgi:hypothetical protein